MKLTHLALVVVLSAATAFGAVKFAAPTAQNAPAKETRLEQIKRTGVLRCGYMVWPPVITKDPNTGKMGGITVDFFEEIGRQLNVKIDWSTEMSPAHAFADLDANRFDVACLPYFITPARARETLFMAPFLFHPSYLYVRADETRFDNNYAAANSPDVTFATLDGEFSSIGAAETFPKAKKLALPQNTAGSDLFLSVIDKKADAVLMEPITFAAFDATNPGKMKRAEGAPVNVMAGSFPLPSKEYDLKNVLDATLIYLQGTGALDAMLDKYQLPTFKFLRLPRPYTDPNVKDN